MKDRRTGYLSVVRAETLLLGLTAGVSRATTTHPFEIFTDNGNWGTNGSNNSDLNLLVDVYNGDQSNIDQTWTDGLASVTAQAKYGCTRQKYTPAQAKCFLQHRNGEEG